jgi:hypothetical protein
MSNNSILLLWTVLTAVAFALLYHGTVRDYWRNRYYGERELRKELERLLGPEALEALLRARPDLRPPWP